MTAPTTSAPPKASAGRHAPDESFDAFFAWIQRYSRTLITAFVVVAAGGLGYLYYLRSEAVKRQRAEEALGRALQAVASGNLPLAQTDLERVVTRYKGTGPGVQAALLLAQTYYETGKPTEGIAALRKAEPEADKVFRASLVALIADGYDLQGKHAEAAGEYARAAGLAQFPTDRDLYRASAARHYGLAGNRAEAIRIWRELADEPSTPVAGEARVRLGELQAEPARS